MIYLSSSGESIVQLIVTLIIFVAVLAVTYFTIKWMGNYQKQHSVNRNLEIIESIRVGSNKFVAVIRTGSDRYKIVGIGKDDIVLLGELDKDELVPEPTNFDRAESAGFKDVLKKLGENFPKKKD